MSDQNKAKIVIIKKRKKGHAGGHGGSWKVAYADFVTAMMAFFLLMWLLNMAPKEKQAAIAQYFQEFSIFDASPSAIIPALAPAPPVTLAPPPKKEPPPPVAVETVTTVVATGPAPEEVLGDKLKQEVEEKLNELKDQVIITKVAGKVRVEIVDKTGSPLYASGKAVLNSGAKEIFKTLTGALQNEAVRVTIEGHTDAVSFTAGKITNWELSTERASAARKEMERNGFDATKIAMVAGYAATNPFVQDDPYDPRNRRISLLLEIPPKPKTAKPTELEGQANVTTPEEPANSTTPADSKDKIKQEMDRVYERPVLR